MRIFNILKNKKYLMIMLTSSVIVFSLFPIIQIQTAGGFRNIDLWFEVIPKTNLILVIIFSILFGLFFSFYVYNTDKKICSLKEKRIGVTQGSLAAIMGILVPACPACAPLIALFLPASLSISVAAFFNKYSTLLLTLSLLLLVLGIYVLGGFKES